MQVLIAVIEDLFQFAKGALFGSIPYVQTSQVCSKNSYKKHPVAVSNVEPSTSTTSVVFKAGEQYFVSSTHAYMYQDPVVAFDNALVQLAYGQHVRLIHLQGRWAQVRLAGTVGWVFKDILTMYATDIYPQFVSGVQYDASHLETIKLRACIDDMFLGGRSGYPLSPSEYVEYRLQQKKLYIDWGDIRMRIPGTWQRKLAGRTGIHIGIAPKTDSVMEYVYDDVGYLAFVETVFPDESIKISEIGKYDDASYSEMKVSSEEWKALQAVFINIV